MSNREKLIFIGNKQKSSSLIIIKFENYDEIKISINITAKQ